MLQHLAKLRQPPIQQSSIATTTTTVEQVLDDAHDINEFPSLFIGGSDSARVYNVVHVRKFTHVIHCCNRHIPIYNSHIRTLHIPLIDSHQENVLHYFNQVFTFIDQALTLPQCKILIRCEAGVSRSVTMAAAYIMKSKKCSAQDAIQLIRQSHRYALPNDGYLEQLCLFQLYNWETSDELVHSFLPM
jgi:dual specificity phosphatase 12